MNIVWYFTGRNIPKTQSGQAIAQKSTAQSHMQQQQPNKHLQTSAEVVRFLAPQGIFWTSLLVQLSEGISQEKSGEQRKT